MAEEIKNNPLKDLFNSANSVLLILPPDPGQDMLSAGLSLHLSLKSSGKSSQIGCSTELVSFESLQGIAEVRESVGNKNLQITFDFPEEYLEKVDYDISENGKFSLLIKPKSGHSAPDINDVKFSYSGADADLVVVFGINSLEELGKIYADEKKFLDNATLLSINNIGQEASFTPNMFHLANSSFSELICLLLQRLDLLPTPEAANNLLATIFQTTTNLTSPKMTAETFASISYLLKNGGKLPLQTSPTFPNNQPSKPAFFEPPAPADWKTPKIFGSSQPSSEATDKF